jgi:hypothetical protein
MTALLEGDAKEAVQSLEGDFATGKLPDVEEFTFPGPIAERFYWDNAAVVGIQGPVGSGKTTTLLKSRLRRAIMSPRSVIDGKRRYKLLVVRKTYRELWSTTIPSYLEVYPRELGEWSGGRGDPVRHVMIFEDQYGPIEFTVEFMAFGDDIVSAMRGVQTTDIWLNEADTVPVDVITTGVGRINRWPAKEHYKGLPLAIASYGQICCDFNAPDEDNWCFDVFHDEDKRKETTTLLNSKLPDGARRIEFEFYNQPGFGEPGCENLQNLAAGYYETQIALNRMAGKGDVTDRLVHNKIVYLRVGEPVFKREFSKRIHVADGPLDAIPGVPLRLGLDQGFKGAAIVAQCTGFYRWRILGELHFPDDRLMAAVFGARLAEFLEERWPGFHVEAAWADMAGEQGSSLATEENATWNLLVAKAAGFAVRPQKIGTNRIQPRLEAVRAALEADIQAGEPGLLIDPSCKYLRRGFEARYVWTDEIDKNGDKRKVPNKQFTEANVMDALQYLLLSEHLADGRAPYTKKAPGPRSSQIGHNGGPPLSGSEGGLQTGWDVLNPYGGM